MAKRDPYLQVVRGLAIAAVVLIHCLPQEAASVALRPFLNFAVAAFVFLSGYLTPRERTADVGSSCGGASARSLRPMSFGPRCTSSRGARSPRWPYSRLSSSGRGRRSSTTSSSTCSLRC